jgi:hypothetical protein
MSSTCDLVAERVALGEPLGDAAEHAATCERCRRLAALPTELGATHREVDPGLGFAARMTAGAQQRIVVRRRRRVAGGLAAAVAMTTVGVVVLTREPANDQVAERPAPAPTPAPATEQQKDPWQTDDDAAAVDEDVRALVRLADTGRARTVSASWARISKPLAPYRALLRGVSHE